METAVDVMVEPFRWWWKVSWTWSGRLFEMLFRRRDVADRYRLALILAVDDDILHGIERERLRK